MTAVAGAVFSAAQFNQYVRDNLNETAPAKATAASQLFVSTGVNSIVARVPSSNYIDTQQSTTSTSYADLATPGPSITVDTGTIAIVLFSAASAASANDSAMLCSVAVSGASSVASSDARSLTIDGATANNYIRTSQFHIFTGLTAGSNTFKMQYRVTSAVTGSWRQREIAVIPL
jgi:hypothetical protein